MTPERREAIEKATMIAYLTDDNRRLLSLGNPEELRPVVEAVVDEIIPQRVSYTAACKKLGCSLPSLLRAKKHWPDFPRREYDGRPYLLDFDLEPIRRHLEAGTQVNLWETTP